eukprot:2447543-Prymnesium_polylepis.1
MAQPDEMLEVESPSSPSARVEGWVQYYEYFHKLSEDMQVDAASATAAADAISPCLMHSARRRRAHFVA